MDTHTYFWPSDIGKSDFTKSVPHTFLRRFLMNVRVYLLSHLRQLLAITALAAFATGCGADHSPMASTGETDELAVPAAKKPADDTTDDSDVTKGKGPSRYSMPPGR